MPPQTITDTPPNLLCWTLLHAWQHSSVLLQTLTHLLDPLKLNWLSSVKSPGCQWRKCPFWCCLSNPLQAAQWQGSRIKPANGRQHLESLLWSQFLTVWSEICTPVPCCKSLCRERAVLRLNRLADKTRYLSCWCAVALLRPCPALLKYWAVSWNLRQAWEITLGDTPNLATRRTDEPSWSNWTAWATSQGCRYLTMFTVEVNGPNAKGKHYSNIYC